MEVEVGVGSTGFTGGVEGIGAGLGLEEVLLDEGGDGGMDEDLGGRGKEGDIGLVLTGVEMDGLVWGGVLVGVEIATDFCFFQTYWVGE